jgi:hypothetical protein
LALAVALLGIPAAARAAARRTPTLGPSNTVIDGPSSDIAGLSGLSISRDGNGGLVYLKDVGGVAHVFVSRLAGGSFQAPVQADAGLSGAASQPVIAAGQGGVLLIAFINGGALYVADAANAGTPLAAPIQLAPAAAGPAISLTTFGKGYLAFTDTSSSPEQVRTCFYNLGQWSTPSTSLNVDPGEAAGTGGGRPAVVASGDGIGIVAWGEAGHVYTRRVDYTIPSAAYQQADPSSIDGAAEVSASDPAISSGGDSSYASVAFSEQVTAGGATQTRVVMAHLHAGRYDPAVFRADGLTDSTDGADQPATAVTEYGAGWVTSEHTSDHELWAGKLGTNAVSMGAARVDSSPNTAAPDAVPATAGVTSTLIAWQQAPGIAGPAEIRVRYAPNGADLGAEQVVSSSSQGAADADAGLAAGGDVAGDAAIAWVQGTGSDSQIVAAQLYQAPGSFAPAWTTRYADSANPILAWSPSAESWGAVQYAMQFDGAPLETTYGTETRTPAPVANGPHTWEVTATNRAGLSTSARTATVFVDTVPPKVSDAVSGGRTVGIVQKLSIRPTDAAPPGEPASDASGVALTSVRWGDGARAQGRGPRHAYRRAGRYTITITVTDRAGNRKVAKRVITIKAKVKAKAKAKAKKRARPKKAARRHKRRAVAARHHAGRGRRR